jgi:hypothetical protein
VRKISRPAPPVESLAAFRRPATAAHHARTDDVGHAGVRITIAKEPRLINPIAGLEIFLTERLFGFAEMSAMCLRLSRLEAVALA